MRLGVKRSYNKTKEALSRAINKGGVRTRSDLYRWICPFCPIWLLDWLTGRLPLHGSRTLELRGNNTFTQPLPPGRFWQFQYEKFFIIHCTRKRGKIGLMVERYSYLWARDGGGAGEEAEDDHPVVVGHHPVKVRRPDALWRMDIVNKCSEKR